MKTLVITGCTGVLASRFIDLYHDHYYIIGFSRSEKETSNYLHIQADLGSPSFYSFIHHIFSMYQDIDCFINNAAICNWRNPSDYQGGFLEEMRINTVIPLEISCFLWQNYWSKMISDGKDRSILNISSIAGERYFDCSQFCYAATKTALNRITQDLSKSFQGVRVNAICPNSFPSIITTEKVCENMNSLIQGTENGVLRTIE